MKRRHMIHATALGVLLVLVPSMVVFARGPENCGECEFDVDDDLGENVCPPSQLWKHRFWAVSSYGEYYAPHAQWTCGQCSAHQECGTLFAAAQAAMREHAELAREEISGESISILAARYPAHIRIDRQAHAVELVDCRGSISDRIALPASAAGAALME
jgi:hypothetical protein